MEGYRLKRKKLRGEEIECENIKNGYCNENVCNIIEKMGQGKLGKGKFEKYIDHLFDKPKYPVFEGDDCIQYLQEYVPLHLPQIEYALNDVKDVLEKYNFTKDTINIIDLGGGPATVALAFCRIIPSECEHRFKITTVDASKTFNEIIEIFKDTNTNESIEIVNNLKYNLKDEYLKDEFEEMWSDKSISEIGYDWIIIANSISGIAEIAKFIFGIDKDQADQELNKKINKILNKSISKVLHYNDKVLLTIIEGGGSTGNHFNISPYLSEIEKIGFDDLKIIKPISSIDIKKTDKKIKEIYKPNDIYIEKM
ncbi:MAG: hypothetical protein MOIL_00707 [Candidatus Methanolliviera sp. GoM_oil]|nr:MAG: hypothetical protein MOIL_00707 [Candidatus Methanolliviera sp. GoM_oil]